jgi:riboflavin biosynthesis pyrimidine reductase
LDAILSSNDTFEEDDPSFKVEAQSLLSLLIEKRKKPKEPVKIVEEKALVHERLDVALPKLPKKEAFVKTKKTNTVLSILKEANIASAEFVSAHIEENHQFAAPVHYIEFQEPEILEGDHLDKLIEMFKSPEVHIRAEAVEIVSKLTARKGYLITFALVEN